MTDAYDYTADVLPAGDNILAVITQLVHEQLAAEELVSSKEEELKEAKNALTYISQNRLPALMSEAGQNLIVTATKYTVEIKDTIRASIPEQNQPAAFKFLEETGNGAVIKIGLSADFGKGEEAEKKVQQVVKFMTSLGVAPAVKKGVHPQTLCALIRELLRTGQDVPLDTFGAIIQKEAKIKAPKVKPTRG